MPPEPGWSEEMTENSTPHGCSVSRTLDVIGDAWGFLVLRSAFFGAKRFEDYAGEVAASRAIVSKRLNRFVENRVLERRRYMTRPERFEYRLTEKGRAMYPIFVAMMMWGDRWTDWPAGPPLILTHLRCGAPIGAETVCGACGGLILPQAVSYRIVDPSSLRAGPTEVRLRRANSPQNFLRGRECSVARTLMLFGDRWSFLILRDAFLGKRRYDEFQTELGIASNILADRLLSLCEAKVLERLAYQTGPERFEYRLTERGRALYPSLLAMISWGDEWIFERTRVPIQLTHAACDLPFEPSLVCKTCREPIRAREVRYDYVGSRAVSLALT